MSILAAMAALENSGEAGAVCTIVETRGSTPRHAGSKMLVYADGSFSGTVGGGEIEQRVLHEALVSLTDGHPRLLIYQMVDPAHGDPGICGGEVKVYVEPIIPPATVIVIGGGHVGKAVAHLAKWLGFRVAISDDRAEFCTPEANPDADFFLPVSMQDLPQHYNINPQTYLVLTTRGMNVDLPGLPALLETTAGYIGLIGSRKRWLTTRKALIESGVSEEKLMRVKSPIGIEIQAETPEEIAVSIMAEIIHLRNG